MRDRTVILFLAGDVMTGRGVDQILPQPGDPQLREPYMRDARGYVNLAEAVNGPIPAPVDAAWPWGAAIEVLDAVAPDVRIVNLETSVTTSGEYWPGKGIHYRMHPANVGCLTAARLDVCTLANNHVADFGMAGLLETVTTLHGAGVVPVGAGPDVVAAQRPGVIPLPDGGRVVVLALGTESSGVPASWAAAVDRAGVDFLADLSKRSLLDVAERISTVKRAGDIVVVSVHWGSNWGYELSRDQVRFARGLVEAGADVVFGHSSHHPRPVEVHRDRLLLYGCGDLINDYEGITGYEPYRDDLRLLYFAELDAGAGALVGLRMVPMQARRMRLERASREDARWLAQLLDRISRRRGVRVRLDGEDLLATPAPPRMIT